MARSHSFSGVQKTIAPGVAQTIVFPANEIEGAGVVAYDIGLSGAGNDLADLSAVRVLASGDLIMDLSIAGLRTFIEGTHRTGTTQATTETRLHIPLYMPDLPTMDQRDGCQFPLGAQPQVEIDVLATAVAGTAIIGWTKTDVIPTMVSRIYSQLMNIPASSSNARMSFQDGGIVRGLIANTVGVSRARAVISDREALRVSGPLFLAVAYGNQILATRMGESPVTLTDPFFIPISLGIPAAVGSSFLELDTGATWAGVTNELGIWSVVPLPPPQANGGA